MTMNSKPQASETCQHRYKFDSRNVGVCSLCRTIVKCPTKEGEQPVVLKPGLDKWEAMNIPQKSAWLESAKKYVIEDFNSIGKAATMERWTISESTFRGLEKRWGLEIEKEASSPVTTEISPSQPQPVEGNPKLWPRKKKMEVAQRAEEIGMKQAGEEYHIPWQIVRAWRLAYCVKRVKKAGRPRKIQQENSPLPPPLQPGYQPKASGLPKFPEFNDNWDSIVKAAWLEAYGRIAGNK